ncbi:MMPL family protein [Nonomuraea fuscirosea]|uniref:MMPL family protein n=1 Tax=Nonomuraea fuscirosea TaxID=1291556 RepID=A0A2T0MNP3_9ACTN|nr:MMPL family protein [Nonomuraea fuscirosea]
MEPPSRCSVKASPCPDSLFTLAATVMAVSFAGLTFTRRLDFQQAGFAVAVAILIDATVIRMLLLPA